MLLSLSKLESPVGGLLLVTDPDDVLHALDFHDYEPRMRGLLDRYYPAAELAVGTPSAGIRSALEAYFDGDAAAIAMLRTGDGGTAFQRQVWGALRTIPYGQTRSYGQMAAQIGRPTASRAVGLANGANPVAIVVPCHRVVGAGGALTGFGGGLPRKQWLLEHEGALRPTMSVS